MWLLEVENREDDYRGTESAVCLEHCLSKRTDEAKDVADGGHEDDQQVDQEDEAESNADVHDPAERLVGEEDLEHSPADLRREGRKEKGDECH